MVNYHHLEICVYLLLKPNEIWDLTDTRFSTKSLSPPIITGNSLEVTTLKQIFSLSYTRLFAHIVNKRTVRQVTTLLVRSVIAETQSK
jgi:hypothetical protein